MDSISFEPVSTEELEEARNFILKYFYAFEPMGRAYIGSKEPAQADVDFTVQYLKDGLGVKAINSAGSMIGLSLGYIGQEDDAEALREEADHAEERKWADILRFLAFVQERSALREIHKVDRAYEIQLVAVCPEYRGKSIGRRLIEKQIDIAKQRGFVAVYVDCSSVFTARIMEGLGFQCVQEIELAEYRTDEGRQIFQPEDDIDTAMKSYLKRL